MLAGHQQSDHHVGNLVLRNRLAILVGRVHQVVHDILGILLLITVGILLSAVDSVPVDLSNVLASLVAFAVLRKGSPGQHKVDWSEAHVEVVVEVGDALVELVAADLALKAVRGGEDGKLAHFLGNIDDARRALEISVLLEEGCGLVRNNGHILLESFGGQDGLDEL